MEKQKELYLSIYQSAQDQDPKAFLETRQKLIDADPTDGFSKNLIATSPTEVLRSISASLDGRGEHQGAWQVIELARKMEPENIEVRKTRGLVALSTLRMSEAIKDFGAATEANDPSAATLTSYQETLFPAVSFAPIRFEGLQPPKVEGGAVIRRTVEELQAVVQTYATRLQEARVRLINMGANPADNWLVPDLSHVLPYGLVLLRVKESMGFSIKETLPENMTALHLQDATRRDWQALTLLLWYLGQSSVELPEKITPRPELESAIDHVEFALWACRDKQMSGGAILKQEGYDQPLIFRGLDLDALPAPYAQIMAGDIAELQAMLYWLTKPNLPSPFVQGLRDS